MNQYTLDALEDGITLKSMGVEQPHNHKFFSTPHLMLMHGRKGAGKTSLIGNMLTNNKLFHKHFVNISIISPTHENISKHLKNQDMVWGTYTDERLGQVVERAKKDWENGDESLLILDDAMASKAFDSDYFMQTCSTHRNHGLSIWVAIQDLSLPIGIRNLVDNLVEWRPVKSDIPLVIKLLESPEYGFEELKNLLTSSLIFKNPHDFITVHKKGGKIEQMTKNLRENITLR